MEKLPRPEYPRPQFVRQDWLNLNGIWEFEIDAGNSGRERLRHQAGHLSGRIVVPFCPESRLSGIANTDFMPAVWYRRDVDIPEAWRGSTVLLHFGAADYDTEVWVNGTSVGRHRGGYTPFVFDISAALRDSGNSVTVCCLDDVRGRRQPKGKQAHLYHSNACDYTRTTGIWQTVWLECVPSAYIASARLIPDPENACVHVEATVAGPASGSRLSASARLDGQDVGRGEVTVAGTAAVIRIPLEQVHRWQPGSPVLYDLRLELSAGDGQEDALDCYFGMRSISWDGLSINLNGTPLFQRLVLDQGYYPDGIYTAPSDDDLRRDIEISMELGFNGARMHQRVFEPRYLYWADKLGYLLWGEYASWGLDITESQGLEIFLPEWLEALDRDFSSPAVVGWCPFNETGDHHGKHHNDAVLRQIYRITKRLDPRRPVIDTSGNDHVETDIFDVHDYDQDTRSFAAKFAPMVDGGDDDVYVTFADRQRYDGQPYFVSEYGGIWWDPQATVGNGWGYGNRPASEQEFLDRYRGLTDTLLDNPRICAFCYTQLYDIEQEVNGLYTYDRQPKFDPRLIRAINSRRAAIETTPATG